MFAVTAAGRAGARDADLAEAVLQDGGAHDHKHILKLASLRSNVAGRDVPRKRGRRAELKQEAVLLLRQVRAVLVGDIAQRAQP